MRRRALVLIVACLIGFSGLVVLDRVLARYRPSPYASRVKHMSLDPQHPPTEEDIPLLLTALKDKSPLTRHDAAMALKRLAPEAVAAVGALAENLEDPESVVSEPAAEALGSIGSGAKEAVPALIKALGHSRVETRIAAAKALGKIGPVAKDALPHLRDHFGDKSARTRRPSGIAVWEISGETEPAVEVLIEDLHDILRRLRARECILPEDWLPVVEALSLIGPAAKGAEPTLLEVIRESEPGKHPDVNRLLVEGLRQEAVKALKRIDPEAVLK